MSNDEWAGWRAIIAPAGLDAAGHPATFGIHWRNAPALERRGGYSGPYRSRAEAEQGAREWAEVYDVTELTIEHAEARP